MYSEGRNERLNITLRGLIWHIKYKTLLEQINKIKNVHKVATVNYNGLKVVQFVANTSKWIWMWMNIAKTLGSKY